MTRLLLHGIIPIIQMPFTSGGVIDEPSLRAEVEWAIQAGADGVGMGNASETMLLAEEERRSVAHVIVDTANGRVPVVIATGHQGTEIAAALSAEAQDLGADAVLVMPYVPGGVDDYARYFGAVAAAVDIPIVVQDAAHPIPVALLARLNSEYAHVAYVKAETPDALVKTRRILQATEGRVTVLGGAGGNHIIEQHAAGVKGWMPGTSLTDRFVAVYARLEAGDVDGARTRLYAGILPLATFHAASRRFITVEKEVLRARGVIATTYSRRELPLDPFLRAQLTPLLRYLGITAAGDEVH